MATRQSMIRAAVATIMAADKHVPRAPKRAGMDFFTHTLGSPKYVVAPMVNAVSPCDDDRLKHTRCCISLD